MHHDNKLVEQFGNICRLLHIAHHRRHQAHGPMADPHRGQGRVLALLKLRPEISQKELSYLLDIRQQSLGELLAKLERSGHIERTPSKKDSRSLEVRLTDAGRAAAEQPGGEVPDLFDALNAEEQATLSGYLDRLITAMHERLGGDLPTERHGHGRHRGHDRGCGPGCDDDSRGGECHGRRRHGNEENHHHGHSHDHGHGHARDRQCPSEKRRSH